ncbi:MAG TPA: polymorphic toxin-type HINT domain-containing protein [Pirellulales bacterium]|jgi:hypothetical protein
MKNRRDVKHRFLGLAAIVVASTAWLPSVQGKEPAAKGVAEKSPRESEAAALVEKALTAEAAGDTDARANYLQQALAADPEYAPAHWQLGEIKVENQWLSADSTAATSAWSSKINEYRQLRARTGRTVDGQLVLARWCENAGLDDQAKMHLQMALYSRPTHAQQKEITEKLGLVRFQKQLMPAAKADMIKKHDKELEAVTKKWRPIVTRWRNDLDSRDTGRQAEAARQLKEIKDIAVIPVLETVFGKAGPTAGKAVTSTIDAMPQPKASESLVRFAVLAENEQVRKAAAQALKTRDMFSFVPMLLSGLSNPIEISFQTFAGEGGIFGDRLTLYREGQNANMAYTSGLTAMPNFMFQPGAVVIPQTAVAEARVANQTATDVATAQAAMAENARTEFTNERICATLRIATDADILNDDAKDWWAWWNEYNDTHYSGDRETYAINRSAYTYYSAEIYRPVQPAVTQLTGSTAQTYQPKQQTPPTQPTLPAASANRQYLGLDTRFHFDSGKIACFVPGTIVWTATGKMPIEEVHVGDLVLAQDVESGELGYKPVAKVTKGPVLPLVEMHAGEETIRCTLGHLFWVSGTGWRMAKELKVGDRLHTTKGTLAIDSVVKTGEASCHNLVVPDFNTYFVTDQQILVHDIDVRGPTTVTVPGLASP